ncbi:MAG TPA: zinc-binding dehydrogenase [Ktedonobacteraceae bacterium]|nr:zinc-binding dehydrogenase [Ktedonobacteraceae bacterium]
MKRPDKIAQAAAALMYYLAKDKLEIIVGQTFPLAEAAKAHATISSRNTMEKTVLIVKQRGQVKLEEKYQKEGKGW